MDADQLIRRYEQAKQLRSPFENDWRQLAAFCLPQDLAYWQQSSSGVNGLSGTNLAAARRLSTDARAKKAIPKFATICHRLATPKSQTWHVLKASDPKLMKLRRVQLYFEELNTVLFQRRYDPKARFSSVQTENYVSQGVYGTGCKYVAARKVTPLTKPGLFYRTVHMRDIFILLDAEGNIYAIFRRMFLSAQQAEEMFGRDKLPAVITAELDKPKSGGPRDEIKQWEFVQCVLPRTDYMAGAMDQRRFPLASYYVCLEGRCHVKDAGGYRRWPYITARHFTGPSSVYGISPAAIAFDAIAGANAMKKTILKAGQKAVDPVLLAHDDGIVNGTIALTPGAINYGGVDSQGRKLIQTLETGNIQLGAELLESEHNDIDDAFFVKLFQILVDTPEMTATEVMERVAEKAALLAPTMERMQCEDLAPTIERELDVLADLGMLPEAPPELVEADGEYEVIYTSPLAKSQNAEQVQGFVRIVEMAVTASQATQDAGPLRRINFDAAIPEIASTLSVPARWLHSDDEMQGINEAAQQKDQVAQLSQAAPAIAGLAKAGATMQQMGGKAK